MMGDQQGALHALALLHIDIVLSAYAAVSDTQASMHNAGQACQRACGTFRVKNCVAHVGNE